MHEALKVHHIWYCTWGNAWIIGIERQASLISSFDNVFRVFMVLFGNTKRCFILNCINWEVIQNLFDSEWFRRIWEFCRNLGYWIILWNYLEVKYVFWIHITYELLMWVCHCAMLLVITQSLWRVIALSLWRCLCDMWLPVFVTTSHVRASHFAWHR